MSVLGTDVRHSPLLVFTGPTNHPKPAYTSLLARSQGSRHDDTPPASMLEYSDGRTRVIMKLPNSFDEYRPAQEY